MAPKTENIETLKNNKYVILNRLAQAQSCDNPVNPRVGARLSRQQQQQQKNLGPQGGSFEPLEAPFLRA